MDEKQTHKKRRLFFLVLAAVVAVTAGAWALTKPILALANDPAAARSWIEGLGIWGPAAYLALIVLQIVVAVIPGEPFEILGGYAFGTLRGTVLYLIASAAGGMLVFFFVRRWGMRFARVFFSEEKLHSVRFLHRSPRRDLLFLLLFLIPGTPKDILCYVAGMTDMKWQRWLFICSVGRLPSVITSTVGGDAIGGRDYRFAVAVFAITAVISLIGLIVYRVLCKRNGHDGGDQGG